jgi:hypothetical protein
MVLNSCYRWTLIQTQKFYSKVRESDQQELGFGFNSTNFVRAPMRAAWSAKPTFTLKPSLHVQAHEQPTITSRRAYNVLYVSELFTVQVNPVLNQLPRHEDASPSYY